MSIYQKWIELVKESEYVQKTGQNSFHKYTYITEADMLNALRPKMAELGLLFYPKVAEVLGNSGSVITVLYTYVLVDADSGEEVSMQVVAQGADSQDKGAYKAATGARKYALRQLVLVSTGDDPEEDSDSEDRGALNSNAIVVLRKLREAGVLNTIPADSDPVYGMFTEAVGVPIKKIPNNSAGTNALRVLYAAANEVAKGSSVEDVLGRYAEDAKNALAKK